MIFVLGRSSCCSPCYLQRSLFKDGVELGYHWDIQNSRIEMDMGIIS